MIFLIGSSTLGNVRDVHTQAGLYGKQEVKAKLVPLMGVRDRNTFSEHHTLRVMCIRDLRFKGKIGFMGHSLSDITRGTSHNPLWVY